MTVHNGDNNYPENLCGNIHTHATHPTTEPFAKAVPSCLETLPTLFYVKFEFHITCFFLLDKCPSLRIGYLKITSFTTSTPRRSLS